MSFVRGWKVGSVQWRGAGLSEAAADQTTTLKTLLRKITDLFLRGAWASREHWTQCEFQFPRRLREKARGRTVFGRPLHSNYRHDRDSAIA